MKLFKIKDIGQVVSGATPKTGIQEYWDGAIPWVTPKEINRLDSQYLNDTERKITELGFKSASLNMLPKGSILFTSRAPIGLLAIADIEVCTNQGFKSIILNKGFYPLYIYYVLRNNVRELNDLGTGTTFKELSKTSFEKFKIPVPPFSDQIRIATVLSKTEDLIKKRKESIGLLDEFLKSTFLEMFGDPSRNKKGFKKLKIGDVCKVTKLAGFEYTKYIKYQDEGDIAVVRGLNVKDGRIKLSKLKYIDKNTSDFLSRSKLNKGDVVITYIGINIGEVALIEESDKFHLAPNVAKITPRNTNQLNSFYLLNYLMFNRQLSLKYTTNTAKQALNMGNIRELEILLPDIKIQKEFAEVSAKTEMLKNDLKQSLLELENLYGSLVQKVFIGGLDLSKLEILIDEEYLNLDDDNTELPQIILEELIKTTKGKSLQKNAQKDSDLKTTWDKVSTQQMANWIKEKYTGYHFSSEMLILFLTKEYIVSLDYYSSEELKKQPRLNEADDLKSFLFSALNKEEPNPFIQLNQHFYNGVNENFNLVLTLEDYELIVNRSPKERSGIYFSIIA